MTETEYVKNWFLRADDDLRSSKVLLDENGAPNVICFLTQQVAEKCLKGFLAYQEKHTRKIHNLLILMEECKKIEPSFGKLEDEARHLNQFYIETRYPGDYPEFTQKEAQKAYEIASKIRDFVVDKLSHSS